MFLDRSANVLSPQVDTMHLTDVGIVLMMSMQKVLTIVWASS